MPFSMQGPDQSIFCTAVKEIQLGQSCDWIVNGKQLTDEIMFVFFPPITKFYLLDVQHSTRQKPHRFIELPLPV